MHADISGWNFNEKQSICIVSKYLPMKILISYQRAYSELTVSLQCRKASNSMQLNQVMKVNLAISGSKAHPVPPAWCPEKGTMLLL